MAESGIVRTVLVCVVLASAAPARADIGAVVGARWTSLDGDVRGEGTVGVAAAGVVTWPVSRGFELAAEPGIQLSGSADYRFFYLMVPLLARYSFQVTTSTRVRVVAGIAPAYLLQAYTTIDGEHGNSFLWESIDGIATWNAEVVAGIGFDVERKSGRRLFAELRARRGLVSVDDEMPALVVLNQELGLWFGVTQ
jgi:hypothetical protein